MPLIRVAGIRNGADAAAIEAAIRRCDPAAAIRADWASDLLDVASAKSAAALCGAVTEAGFACAPLRRRPPAFSPRDVLALLGRAVLFAALGAVAGAILGFAGMLAIVTYSPSCHVASDEGACAMGIPVASAGCAGIAALLAAAATMVRGALRLARRAGRG